MVQPRPLCTSDFEDPDPIRTALPEWHGQCAGRVQMVTKSAATATIEGHVKNGRATERRGALCEEAFRQDQARVGSELVTKLGANGCRGGGDRPVHGADAISLQTRSASTMFTSCPAPKECHGWLGQAYAQLWHQLRRDYSDWVRRTCDCIVLKLSKRPYSHMLPVWTQQPG